MIDQDRDGIIGSDDLAAIYNQIGKWGAVVQMVDYRTRNREVAGSTHTRSTASNLEQVANLLYAQINSASYPHHHHHQIAYRQQRSLASTRSGHDDEP